jgi:hypothetical protein
MSFLKGHASRRRARTDEVANDRRRACRSRAVMHDVVLGWEKDGKIGELPAFLEDVSMDGCLAKSRTIPTPHRGDSIWFGLAGSAPTERIEGILIDARKPFLRECSIRIKFLTPLPYATFRYLVYGPQNARPTRGELLEYETDQFWK